MALTDKQKQELVSQYGNNQPSEGDTSGIDSVIESAFQSIKAKPVQKGGIMADIKGIGTGIKEAFTKRTANVGEIQKSNVGGIRKGFQTVGQTAGLFSDVIGQTAIGGVKAVTPEFIQKPAGEAITAGATALANTDVAKTLTESYMNLSPEKRKDIESILGIGSLVGDITGIGLAGKGIKAGTSVAGDIIETGLAKGSSVITPVVDTAKGIGSTIKNIGESIAQTPSRIATNVAETQAKRQAIQALPTESLKKAAIEGVDMADINTIKSISKAEKPQIQKLVDVVKKFSEGITKTNPIEVVGKPITMAVKRLSTNVQTIGAKLDKVAESLRFKTVKGIEELGNRIDDSLKKIDISFKDGKLNLKGSQLEGLGGNETIIQNVYKRFVNAKDASDLHRLKKYIDNNVTFGKTTEGLTGDSERLLKGWRKSIDDTLDNQFPTYKSINEQYKVNISPLNDMKKFLKDLGIDEDLLNMQSGLLARRLTNFAGTNPQIRQILRNIDKALKTKGKTTLSVEKLQDVYNVLDKYYDIAGKTSLQGQVKTGVSKIGDIAGAVVGKVRDFAGTTPATRQKALENALKEILGR